MRRCTSGVSGNGEAEAEALEPASAARRKTNDWFYGPPSGFGRAAVVHHQSMNKFPIAIFAALWVPFLMIDANYLGGTGLFAIASLVGLGTLLSKFLGPS